MSWSKNIFKKMKKNILIKYLNLAKKFFDKISKAVVDNTIGNEVLDKLEDIFIGFDLGFDATIIKNIESRVAKEKHVDTTWL